MTCIIAHRDGWMVADLDHAFTDFCTLPCRKPKVRQTYWVTWATCGSATLSDLVHEALSRGNCCNEQESLACIAGVFRDKPNEGEALVLTRANQMFLITSSGAILPVDAEYWATGSGYQAALGYLRGRHDGLSEGSVTLDEARRAIAFAAELNSNISVETTCLRTGDSDAS